MTMKYSDHLDTMIALISNLSLTKNKSRTPTNIAKELSIKKTEVEKVLNGFPGIFRKSQHPAPNGDYYFTLQIRYALRWKDPNIEEGLFEDEGETVTILDDKYISTLFTYVINMVNQEKENWRVKSTNIITIIASIVAFIASIIAISIKQT